MRAWEKLESDFLSLGPVLPSQGLCVFAVSTSQAVLGTLGAGKRAERGKTEGIELGEVLWNTPVLVQTIEPSLWVIHRSACQYGNRREEKFGGIIQKQSICSVWPLSSTLRSHRRGSQGKPASIGV